MPESGSPIGTIRTTISMRRMRALWALTRGEWSDRFAAGPGTARWPILRHAQEVAGGLRYRPTAQAFSVLAALRGRSSRSSRVLRNQRGFLRIGSLHQFLWAW